MTDRIHIDAPAGVIDVEGEKEFVEGMLTKLFPLIEKAGFGNRPQSVEINEVVDEPLFTEENTLNENADVSKKRVRKSMKQPPAGQSCPARIQILKDEGFFKEHRGPGAIVLALRIKGWTHNLNQVGAATSSLFNKGSLQRTKDNKGPWQYYWDRTAT
ncbi:hypothetical protein [Pararhizobium sp.]|uniref:hypothetical protein n=1 Tax=Pararhizobium sp. TaxID=1977563 RepID=UPI0027229EB1|nr:hypothetical protein [Pararhizobium sp.]MDO9417079.1 hypothetical protein [Pararhizobium sp.]